jgi:hypothetical protein
MYWEAWCEHHLAAWIARFWFLNAAMVSGWIMRGNAVGIWLGGCDDEDWGVFGVNWDGKELEDCDWFWGLEFTGERFAIVGVELTLLALAGDGSIVGVFTDPDPCFWDTAACASTAACCCLSISQ